MPTQTTGVNHEVILGEEERKDAQQGLGILHARLRPFDEAFARRSV